jgi:hypothetical protein
MTFKSDAQRKLMYAIANNPAVAKKTGISKKVADKFIQHKSEGGNVKKHEDTAQDKAMVKKAVHAHEKAMHKGKPLTKLAKGGKLDGCAMKGKTKGTMR